MLILDFTLGLVGLRKVLIYKRLWGLINLDILADLEKAPNSIKLLVNITAKDMVKVIFWDA